MMLMVFLFFLLLFLLLLLLYQYYSWNRLVFAPLPFKLIVIQFLAKVSHGCWWWWW